METLVETLRDELTVEQWSEVNRRMHTPEYRTQVNFVDLDNYNYSEVLNQCIQDVLAETAGKCRWRNVANNDTEKWLDSQPNITLAQNSYCNICSGSYENAKQINCKNYVEKK
ncbi:MAG: hypothetical protein WC438_04215 [Candidatus Pacearchaeota archaeon]